MYAEDGKWDSIGRRNKKTTLLCRYIISQYDLICNVTLLGKMYFSALASFRKRTVYVLHSSSVCKYDSTVFI